MRKFVTQSKKNVANLFGTIARNQSEYVAKRSNHICFKLFFQQVGGGGDVQESSKLRTRERVFTALEKILEEREQWSSVQ